MTDILCVGIACVDILGQGFEEERFLKNREETHRISSVNLSIGGDAANQAVILSRLGNQVKILCGIGDDILGNVMQTSLMQEKIDCSGIQKLQGAATSCAMVLIALNGERRFISPKTNLVLPFQVKSTDITKAKIVSLASIGSRPFRDIDQIKLVVEQAKKQQSIVCADVICSDWLQDVSILKEVLPNIDYLFPNEEEASILTKKTDMEKMAEVFLSYGVKNVIIKTGKKRCFAKSKSEQFYIPAIPNIVAKDTTGAGDNFASGFMTALLEQKNLKECCEYAAAVAAVSVQSVGATTGVLNRKQMEQYLND